MEKDNPKEMSVFEIRNMLRNNPDIVLHIELKEDEDEGSKNQACDKDSPGGV